MKRARVKPINRERATAKRERNFTAGADKDTWIRSLPCIVAGCRGFTVAAHAIPRGMGGSNGDAAHLLPMCWVHHDEAGERGTSQRLAFEQLYGLPCLIMLAAEYHARWRAGLDTGAPF